MTLRVDPADLVAYAAQLRESWSDVSRAKNYLHLHGDFSFHQTGIIGALAGQHVGLMNQLEKLHDELLTILWRSAEAMTESASSMTRRMSAAQRTLMPGIPSRRGTNRAGTDVHADGGDHDG
jgi:hypothetical protein